MKFCNLCKKKSRKRSNSMKKIFPNKIQDIRLFKVDEEEKKKDEPKKELSFYEKVNNKLLEVREDQRIYEKTNIPPFYFLAIILTCASIIVINLFNKNLSLSLATVYPLFMTFKAIQYYDKNDLDSKEEVIHWLKYWIFYSFLLNFETWFSYFLKQFYTFCKFFLLLNCFPIGSGLLEWIYSIILSFFIKYEDIIIRSTTDFYRRITDENSDREDNDNDNNNLGGFLINRFKEGKAAYNIMKKAL